MRPLELRLRNFRSYRDEVSFDFRGRRLLGIVGPIGSGKSTILDAISFALYGRTARVGRETKSLINQHADDAGVALRFEADGRIWEVQRILRRRGQAQHALYRLASDDAVAERVEKVLLKDEVDAKIETILGLDFDAFGRSVLLAQGRFAEFLEARPGERDKVLKGLFGYDRVDRMRERAKALAHEHELDLRALEEAREGLERDRLERERLLEELAVHEAERRRLAAILPDYEGIEAALQRTRTEAERLAGREAELEAVESELPARAELAALDEELDAAERRRRAAEERREEAEAELAAATARLAELDPSTARRVLTEAAERAALLASRRADLAELRDRIGREEEALDRGAADLAEAERLVAEREGELAVAAARREEAARRLDAAEHRLHELRHRHLAATLRKTLTVGKPCPVCDVPVAAVPPASAVEELGPAEAAVAVAKEARRAAEEAYVAASQAAEAARSDVAHRAEVLEKTRSALDELVDRARRLEREVEALEGRIAELVGEGPVDEVLGRRRGELDAAETAVAEARSMLSTATEAAEEAARAHEALRARREAAKPRLLALAARLELDVADDDPLVLHDLLRSGLEAARSRHVDERGELRRRIEELEAARRKLLAELDLDRPPPAALAAVEAKLEVLTERREVLDRRLAEADELADRLAAAEAGRARFERLAADLTDTRFVRFLLEEERMRLAAVGSEHLDRLSAGRYRFTPDGRFDVVDLAAADRVRKADSLSGGETFLASLALALALAELVVRTGGRLDAFFLDEGFGTLDPEHLDLAMEGIETLVAGAEDRLVIVVSHVPEMRIRIEDLIELDRDPITGTTIVRRS